MSIARTRPSAELDNPLGGGPGRASAYRDAYVVQVGNGRGSLAEEGSYFTANNATTATEIAGHAAAVAGDEDNKPFLYLYNGGSRYITIDHVQLRQETVLTGDSDTYITVCTTNEQSRDSGGTQLTVNNARSDNPTSSAATVYAGAVICTPSDFKLQSRTLLRQATDVTEDRIYIQFGEPIVSGPAYVATISDLYRTLPPVCIAPGGEFLFAIIAIGSSVAGDYEVELGFWER